MYNLYVGFNGGRTRWIAELIKNLQQSLVSEGVRCLFFDRSAAFSSRHIRFHPDEFSILQRTMNAEPLVKSCWLVIPPEDKGPYYDLVAQASVAFANGIPVIVCTCGQGQAEDQVLQSFVRRNGGKWQSFIGIEEFVDALTKAVA